MWNLEQSTIAEWIQLKYLGEQSASSSPSSQRHPQQCHHRHHFRTRAVYPNGVGFSSSLPASTCSPPSSSQFAHHRLSRFHVKYIFFQFVPPNKYPTHWSHPTGKNDQISFRCSTPRPIRACQRENISPLEISSNSRLKPNHQHPLPWQHPNNKENNNK